MSQKKIESIWEMQYEHFVLVLHMISHFACNDPKLEQGQSCYSINSNEGMTFLITWIGKRKKGVGSFSCSFVTD